MTSAQIMSQVYGSDLLTRAVSVCMYLLHRADHNLQCYPGIKTIARELKMSEPTVKRALRDLMDAGFLLKVTRWRQNGGQSSNLYILKSVDKPVEKPMTPVESAEAKDKGIASAQTNAATAAAPQDDIGNVTNPDCGEGTGNAPLAPTCSSGDDIIDNPKSNPGQQPCRPAMRVVAAFSAISSVLLRALPFFSACFLPVHTAFLASVTPSPGHEYTPNVNLPAEPNNRKRMRIFRL